MKRILVATDGSMASAAAEQEAVRLCGETGAELVIVHSWEPVHNWIGEPHYREAVSKVLREARETLDRPLELADQAGIRVTTELLEGSAGQVICEVAETHDVDLIVVGARRYGIVLRFFLGSVSRAVLQRSSRPVLVVKEGIPVPAVQSAEEQEVALVR